MYKFVCIIWSLLFWFVDFSFTTEEFIKECNIANKFDHPNVLSLIGVTVTPEEAIPLMVMPYMHHGDVKSFVKSKRGGDVKVESYPVVKLTMARYVANTSIISLQIS